METKPLQAMAAMSWELVKKTSIHWELLETRRAVAVVTGTPFPMKEVSLVRANLAIAERPWRTLAVE